MKHRKSIRSMLGFVLAFMVTANAADAPKLSFKFTKANVPGALQTIPGGINNAGASVGQYQDKNNVLHGYILTGKKLVTLDDPNGTNTAADSLTPNGTITVVGTYVNSSGVTTGFQYKNGTYSDIPGPAGATSTVPAAVNDYGVIVGFYTDSSGVAHGFLLNGNGYTTIDVPGAMDTYASGIDNKENMVLFWLDSSSVFESSMHNAKSKRFKTINVPGAPQSEALDLNQEGDVTYAWFDSNSLAHGALLHKGKYYKFDYPKSVQTYGGGINDKAMIVGGFQAQTNGPLSGFIAAYF